MSIFLLIAAAWTGVGTTPAQSHAARVIDPFSASLANCPEIQRRASGHKVEAKRLGELPPGELSLAVLREVDGCPEPTVVSKGYGAGFDPPEGAKRGRR